jgi:hypothetical protein
MVSSGRVDDHGPILTVTEDLPHAKSVPLEPPPDLGSAQVHNQPVTFDVRHGLEPHPPVQAARFLFHAFRFFRTIRIEIQGMKKNKPTASLVNP